MLIRVTRTCCISVISRPISLKITIKFRYYLGLHYEHLYIYQNLQRFQDTVVGVTFAGFSECLQMEYPCLHCDLSQEVTESRQAGYGRLVNVGFPATCKTVGILDFLTTQQWICSICPPLGTPGYARVYLGANLQTTGFAAQLRLKWVADCDFLPFALPIRVQYPTTPPNSVLYFQIQVQMRNLGVGLRFCMQLSTLPNDWSFASSSFKA